MRKRYFRCLYAAALCGCLWLAAWSGCEVWKTLKDYSRGERDLRQVYDIAAGAEAYGDGAPENAESGFPTAKDPGEEESGRSSRAVIERLKEVNQDTIGWVRIEGTAVDYPVMHTPEEPEFYLSHGFDGESSAYGMIFMDGACSLDGKCLNYVLYGHHMKNGAMFAELENYASQEYCEEHPVIEFDTLEESGCYEVMAAFRLPESQLEKELGACLAAETEEDYRELTAYARRHSLYDTGILPERPVRLLTLVTCEYTEKNGRFFVIACRLS